MTQAYERRRHDRRQTARMLHFNIGPEQVWREDEEGIRHNGGARPCCVCNVEQSLAYEEERMFEYEAENEHRYLQGVLLKHEQLAVEPQLANANYTKEYGQCDSEAEMEEWILCSQELSSCNEASESDYELL